MAHLFLTTFLILLSILPHLNLIITLLEVNLLSIHFLYDSRFYFGFFGDSPMLVNNFIINVCFCCGNFSMGFQNHCDALMSFSEIMSEFVFYCQSVTLTYLSFPLYSDFRSDDGFPFVDSLKPISTS